MPVRQATPEDCTPLFHLINGSYHRETGDNAPAFKKSLRFLSPAELLSHPSYTSNCCLVAEGPSGALLGVLCYEIQNHDGILRAHFGPFAVDEAHQGKGVGKELIDALLEKAKLAGCASIDAEVVNHRLDLFPMYLGTQGFRVIGEDAFPAPDRLTRPCHFVCIRRPI